VTEKRLILECAGKVMKYKERHLRIFEKGQICCKDIRRMYGEVVEGDLPPSLDGRLQEHIRGCEECKEFTQTYLLTIDLAKSLRDAPIPAGVSERLKLALSVRLGISI
jgi:hypothetical protein